MILPQSSTGPSDTFGGAMLSWGWSIPPGELVVAISKEFRKHPTKLLNVPNAPINVCPWSWILRPHGSPEDLEASQRLPWMAIGLWFWWLPLVGIRHIRHLHSQMEYWMGHSGCQDIEIRNPKNLLKDFERLQKIIHTLLQNFPKLTFLKWW